MPQSNLPYPDSPYLAENQLQENIAMLRRQAEQLENRNRLFAGLRIISFLIALVLVIFFANARYGLGIWATVILFPPLFAWLVNRHGKFRQQLRLTKGKIDANQKEMYRLNRQLSKLEGGESYLTPNHPYAADLDVFGKHSLFGLLNRTATGGGAKTLAGWLASPAALEELEARQGAVQELQNQHAWRHTLEASGYQAENKPAALESLYSWFSSANLVLQKPFYQTAFLSLPLISLALLLGYFFADWSYGWVLLAMGVNGFIIYRLSSYTQQVQQATEESLSTLDTYTLLFQQVEQSSFQHTLLKQLKQQLVPEGKRTASSYLRELSRILHGLDSRSNIFYQLLNLLFLLDLYWLRRAERWKLSVATHAPAWLSAVHSVEALSSLAGFAALEKTANYPTLKAGAHFFKGTEIAHPLLLPHVRIANDLQLAGEGQVALITGSNMAGKSTFLRTVGLNIVLGLSGAPVCAAACSLSRMLLFTSMRTQDSLEESASAFYAELRRIQQLLALSSAWQAPENMPADGRLVQYAGMAPSELPVFFLLDEVLKGTNSRDRHLGAAALIRQLRKAGASGLVSTHDLSLGQLGEEGIENYSFNSYLEKDELVFPYKLEAGLCHSFNASQLMARMGIAIPEGPPADQPF